MFKIQCSMLLQGGHENGILENCVKEPLLTSWDSHGESKDLRITENPQVCENL